MCSPCSPLLQSTLYSSILLSVHVFARPVSMYKCLCPFASFHLSSGQGIKKKKKKVSKVSAINETSLRGRSSGLVKTQTCFIDPPQPPTHPSAFKRLAGKKNKKQKPSRSGLWAWREGRWWEQERGEGSCWPPPTCAGQPPCTINQTSTFSDWLHNCAQQAEEWKPPQILFKPAINKSKSLFTHKSYS